MIVDGKAIAADILASTKIAIEQLSKTPTMAAITCAPNFETKKYLEMKKRRAASIGVTLNVVELPEEATTEEALACVDRVSEQSDGVVVQLPLPAHMDKEAVLTGVPHGKDPDGFLYGTEADACLPPVVGAIDEISKQHNIDWSEATVVVLGEGRLVGTPAVVYAKDRAKLITVLTAENFDQEVVKSADILITGIGQPKFVTKEMVKPGVVIFDAGTSEDGGVLVGDVDPTVADVAALITPVPGGIGPITIAYLLKNLVALARQ
tara:strand:- start:4286 stop:5077 length:792 start_codon:yes stop_codon:yes gene_type:complete